MYINTNCSKSHLIGSFVSFYGLLLYETAEARWSRFGSWFVNSNQAARLVSP